MSRPPTPEAPDEDVPHHRNCTGVHKAGQSESPVRQSRDLPRNLSFGIKGELLQLEPPLGRHEKRRLGVPPLWRSHSRRNDLYYQKRE